MSNHFTITGRLGSDPEIRFTASGQALCNVRVVDQERRKNEQTGQWEDAGEPLWLSGTVWGVKGEAFGNVARKGDLVTLTGRLTARSWDDKQTGDKRTATEIKVFDAAIVPKVDKQQQPSNGFGGQQADLWTQPQQSDPWSQPQQQRQAPQPTPGSGGGAPPAYDEPPF